MSGVVAMDSGGLDARVLADHPDSRTLTETERQPGPFRGIGQSPEWRQALRQAAQVAVTDTTVFLQGESGTGKEVVARFIHRASPRKHGSFVAINCAALPEQLLESELFGFERGAFTSAHQAKPGQIELAAWSTLPGRNHRADAFRSSEGPSSAAGARVSAAWGHAAHQGQCASDRRNESRSVRRRWTRTIPRGSLLSRQRVRNPDPAAPGAPRRHHLARRDLSPGVRTSAPPAHHQTDARRDRRAARACMAR
jgi:hypothetical protein